MEAGNQEKEGGALDSGGGKGGDEKWLDPEYNLEAGWQGYAS